MDNLDFNYFCNSCTKDKAYREANCFTSCKIEHYKKGEYITYKGTKANRLSILTKGSVDTMVVLDSGIVFTTKRHNSPYPLGALALFSEKNYYRADIVAVEDCDIISVSRDVVESQMSKCTIFLRNFIAYNSLKLDLFTRHLSILSQRSIKSKLAFYIFTLSNNQHFTFDKSIESLANYLCVERPSLSRVLAQLVKDKIISYNRGIGEILDVNRLKELLD